MTEHEIESNRLDIALASTPWNGYHLAILKKYRLGSFFPVFLDNNLLFPYLSLSRGSVAQLVRANRS